MRGEGGGVKIFLLYFTRIEDLLDYEECGHEYSNPANLERHMQTIHQKRKEEMDNPQAESSRTKWNGGQNFTVQIFSQNWFQTPVARIFLHTFRPLFGTFVAQTSVIQL